MEGERARERHSSNYSQTVAISIIAAHKTQGRTEIGDHIQCNRIVYKTTRKRRGAAIGFRGRIFSFAFFSFRRKHSVVIFLESRLQVNENTALSLHSPSLLIIQ